MRSLLLKDWLVLSRQMRILLVVIVVFAAIPNDFLSSYAIVYAAMLPVSAAAYDEQSKWNVRAGMMPYSGFSIVFEKYILGYIASAGTMLISLLVGAVMSTLTGGRLTGIYLLTLCSLLLVAVSLPLIFRFGVEKARVLIIILVCITAVAGGNASDAACSVFSRLPSVPTLLAVAAVVAQPLSVYLSLRIYKAGR